MHEHDEHRLRLVLRDALRRDSYVAGINESPPLHVFTDGMHQEYVRLYDAFRGLRNTELWLDSIYGTSVPAIAEARDQSQESLDVLKAKCRDGMTYAADDLQIAWKKHLRPAMTQAIDLLGNYTMVLLEQSRKEERFGSRIPLGRTARVSFRPRPTDSPDYLGLHGEFTFDEQEEFDQIVAEPPEVRTIDYVPTGTSTLANLGPVGDPHRQDIKRMAARLPSHVRGLLSLEHGLKVGGEGEGVTVLLLHNTAVAVYEYPARSASSNRPVEAPPQPNHESTPPSPRVYAPEPTSRQSTSVDGYQVIEIGTFLVFVGVFGTGILIGAVLAFIIPY